MKNCDDSIKCPNANDVTCSERERLSLQDKRAEIESMLLAGDKSVYEVLIRGKNLQKEPFPENIFELFFLAVEEIDELRDELTASTPDYDKIKYEAADACAFLFKIIEMCRRQGRNNVASKISSDLLTALDEIERLQKEIKALKKDPEQSCANCTGNGLQSVWPSQCTSCTPGGDDSFLRNWKLKETTN